MPSYDYNKIKALADALKQDVWAHTHKEWEEDDTYMEGTFKVRAPRKVAKNVPATGRGKVLGAVSQLITSEPTVSRRPVGTSAEAQLSADRIETWGTLILRRLDHVMSSPPFKDFSLNLFLYGYAILYGPLWNDTDWPYHPERGNRRRNAVSYREEMKQWEKKIAGCFPYWASAPHPSKVLLDPNDGKVPAFGIIRENRYVISLQREFGEDKIEGNPYDLKEVMSFFSEDQILVAADEDVIHNAENKMGFVPFTQAFAGFGRDSAASSIGESLSQRSVGLLRHIRHSLRSEANIATMRDHMIWRAANQHLFTTTDAVELAQQMEDNIVVEVDDTSNIRWEEAPNFPVWIIQALSDVRIDIDAGTYGDVLRGVRPMGVSTASQHAQIVSKAKLPFRVPMQQINHVAGIFLSNCGRLLEVYQDPVTVEGSIGSRREEITIEAEDFADNYRVEVDYQGSDPMEEAAELEKAMALRQSIGPDGQLGAIDWETLIEASPLRGRKEEVRRRLDVERAFAMPEIQQAILEDVVRRWNEMIGATPQQQQPPAQPQGPPMPMNGMPMEQGMMGAEMGGMPMEAPPIGAPPMGGMPMGAPPMGAPPMGPPMGPPPA